MTTVAAELQRILEQRELHILFQPIVHHSHDLLGYEALVRGPVNSPLYSAGSLFSVAQQEGSLLQLEMLCRELAIRRFVNLKLGGKLFLNVSPMALLDKQHYPGQTIKLVEQYGLDPKRVVIELSELYPTPDTSLLILATRHYSSMGFEIAIDDLGAGYSGLKLWSEITPDYVKIDRHFVANIHDDRIKKEFVRFIRDISERIGCKVIAEGIELPQELNELHELKIDYLQGYLLGRPAPHPGTFIHQRDVLQFSHSNVLPFRA